MNEHDPRNEHQNQHQDERLSERLNDRLNEQPNQIQDDRLNERQNEQPNEQPNEQQLEHRDALMEQITAALEAAPSMHAPDDFAARVMARVPQHSRLPQHHSFRNQMTRRLVAPAITRASYGRSTVFAAMLLLLAAMVYFAPATRNSILWTGMQSIVFAQLAALVLWFGWLRRRA